MLKTNITLLKTMVEGGIVDKSVYPDVLQRCDESMQSFLTEKGFVYHEPTNLFRYTTDERMQQILEKKKEATEHPEAVIQEVTQKLLATFESFLGRYKFGFLHDAKMAENGYAEIDIATLITSGFSDGQRESARQKLEMQMQALIDEGFIIRKNKHNYYLAAEGQNIENIRAFLEARGARAVTFTTFDEAIRNIKFRVNACDIQNFKSEAIQFKLPVSDELNKDEQLHILKCCNDILSTLSMLPAMENIKDTCCSVMEGYFSDICDVFNFNGTTRQNVQARHKAEREKNIAIRDMEASLADFVDPAKIKEILYPVKEEVSLAILRKTGFTINEFTIGRYGTVNMSFNYSACPALYCEDPVEIEKSIHENFEHNNGDVDNEQLYLLDTYANKAKLEAMIAEIIPTFHCNEFTARKTDHMYCIVAFTGFVDNLLPLMKKFAK